MNSENTIGILISIFVFSKDGITWQINTSDMTANDKKLKRCLDSILGHLEEDSPRYYRLKDKIFSKNLQNKLW